jgi:hypothetical protein
VRRPLAKAEPREVPVYLVKDGGPIHLATKEPPLSGAEDVCCAFKEASRVPTYLGDFKRVVFRVTDGGPMSRICSACVRACPRARIVESPPKKKKAE